MANTYTSLKTSYDTARGYKENISNSNAPVNYVFLGNSIPYDNESVPDQIFDTVQDEKTVWDTMFAAKKITESDVELVIPRVNWTSNTVYKQFDDTVDLEDLLSANNITGYEPMYVITDEGNVYKCLCNDVGRPSTIKPTGDYSSSNGFISTADDHLWKYMFNVSSSNKFLSSSWIPSPIYLNDQKYNLSQTNIVDGALIKIVMTDRGSGYYETSKQVNPFNQSVSTITLSNRANVSNGMFVSGVGIATGTFITNLNTIANTITLSEVTISSGGGSNTANNLSFSTRIVIDGDGNNDTEVDVRYANDEIEKITVTSFGTEYSRANVLIYGSGTGATARAVFGPKYGHGFNPAKELGARYAMISEKIGEIDSTESGLIATDISFRQYGIVNDAHKYGNTSSLLMNSSNNFVSQTFDLTLVAGGIDYINGESVYQGASNTTATFSGIVHSQDIANNVLNIINVRGFPIIGSLLYGEDSLAVRPLVSFNTPYFEPYSGNILYVNNVTKIDRYEGQAENLKIVLKF